MGKGKKEIPSALRHGVYSAMAVLPGEDQAAFEQYRREIIAEYNLSGRSEEELGDYLARAATKFIDISDRRTCQKKAWGNLCGVQAAVEVTGLLRLF